MMAAVDVANRSHLTPLGFTCLPLSLFRRLDEAGTLHYRSLSLLIEHMASNQNLRNR